DLLPRSAERICGSRRSPASRGSRISACMAPKRRRSTVRGSPGTSSDIAEKNTTTEHPTQSREAPPRRRLFVFLNLCPAAGGFRASQDLPGTPTKHGTEPQNPQTPDPRPRTSEPQNLRTSEPQNLRTSEPQNLRTSELKKRRWPRKLPGLTRIT